MTYTLVIQPPMLPGECTYPCKDADHLRTVVTALNTLGVEIVDVLADGESLTIQEYQELLAE